MTLAEELDTPEDVWRARAEPGGGGACFVVEDAGGTLVGLAVGLLPPGQTHPLLAGLWVAPEARRRRAATRLVGEVAGWAQATDATRLTLWVFDAGVEARALFAGLGFLPTGARLVPPPDIDRDEDDVRPERELGLDLAR
jgi:GNAT superfamily N-acetyltransferase